MGIQTIANRDSAPIIGVIRLGIKVKTQSGSERPDNAPHFVLHDAPQVEAVYGKNPQELDVIFPSDDLDAAVPTWLKWWRPGARDASGKAISGILRCKGNGPAPDGAPGEAQYFDKMDPKTGVVPTRPCLGDKCPDWKDAKGNPQCKPNMQIFVYLPKVSPFGIFKISTTSWTSIKSFYDQLAWIKKLNNGAIRGICFKMVKAQKAFTSYDANGNRKDRSQWVVLLKPNENKLEIEGMRQSINLLEASSIKWAAPVEQLEAPAEDIPHLEAAEDAAVKVATAEDLVKDPEVSAGFDALGAAMGAALPLKDRLIMIRKKEKEPDIKKAVLEAIGKAVASVEAKNKAKAVEAAPPPPQSAPAEQAGGLI